MPLTRIKTKGLGSSVTFENITDTGTAGTKVAVGTTAQRGSVAGQWRYNTDTGFFEGRNTNNTFSTLEPTPTIISSNVTEIESAAGGNVTIRITGTNFTSGATIKFRANDNTEVTANTSTYINTSTYDAVVPRASFSNALEPYDIKYTSQTGIVALLEDILNVDNAPNWTTSSGTVATISDQATGNHVTLAATDADGDTVTYSETGGTNLSGAGLSLASDTGIISGNPTDVANSTTVSFTGRATAGSKTTDRSFNIIIDPYREVYFGVLGAAGGGAGRSSSSYQGSSSTRGAGGAGSFVEAVYEIKLGTVVYYYVGNAGNPGTSSAGGSGNTYGGDGASSNNGHSGEGGDFSGIFTANSISQTNALIIAGGGGGGASRPHGGGSGTQNGGGMVESASTGEGNDGGPGNNTSTSPDGRGGQGGQQNAGGAAGSANAESSNSPQQTAGTALYGGQGAQSSSWGAGGGGGAGFFGGGGGADDGTSWGGQGGGAGSSFIRGAITNYTTTAFNSVAATGITYNSHTFRTRAYQNDQRQTYDFTSAGFGSGYGTSSGSSNGYGGRENSAYPGSGDRGGHGLVFWKVGSGGSYTKLDSVGTLTALTIS